MHELRIPSKTRRAVAIGAVTAAFALVILTLAASRLPATAAAKPDPAPTPGLSACAGEPALSWTPTTPRAGTIFRVRAPLRAAPATWVGGEPLHFSPVPGGGDDMIALAAVPVDSGSGITLVLRCANGADSLIRIPTTPGDYPLERLTVAPRFSAPPSAALSSRMREESARAAAVSRASHDTPQLWSLPFAAPRPTRITSAFGGGRMFNGTVTSRHMGTDFAGAVGTPVKAINRGVVRLVDRFYLGGNVIYVDHGAGLVSAYLHLSKQLAAEGDTVQRGDVIGHVGATGRVTGPHLHLIARYGAVTVDGAALLEIR